MRRLSGITLDSATGRLTGNEAIVGEYGTLTVFGDGSWSYRADATELDSMPQDIEVQDVFGLRVVDASGQANATSDADPDDHHSRGK